MSLALLKGSVYVEERVAVTIEGIFLFCRNGLGISERLGLEVWVPYEGDRG